jgi:glutamate/tyrosine decarboxylase-like PLP-dependent enzyme
MREMGRQTVELLVEMLAQPEASPVVRRATRAEMTARLDAPPPSAGRPFGEVLAELRDDIAPVRSRTDHPGYLAFVPGNGTFPGALGDFVASALNIICDSWLESGGPTQLELTVLDWFRQWIGYPECADGILLSGGSAANHTALGCARETLLGVGTDDGIVYVSDQSHSSVARAARSLGFHPHQLRVLPTDDEYRLRVDALEAAMRTDRDAGGRPAIVCASAGSTNTGAIDPLPELADVCEREGLWLHVDGAYGGFAVITERGSARLRGIERADSVTLDPHKWLYQPFECGCLLVRKGRLLGDTFRITPDYLRDLDPSEEEVNFSDRSLQLTRMARSLKVWLSIQTFGLDAFRAAIDSSLDTALAAQERIERGADLELMRSASLGIVCFRRRFGGALPEPEVERLNRGLLAALEASGRGFASSTRLRGRYAIRFCILNHATSQEYVLDLLDWLERLPVADLENAIPTAPPPAPGGRQPDLGQLEAAGGGIDPEVLREAPLFAGLDPDRLQPVAAEAGLREVAPGETVTARWGQDRDFYVVLSGRFEVEVDGELVRELGPGDFFGELAALDWGAGYGYARLATVRATEGGRVISLPPRPFNRLLGESPEIAAAVRAAVAERLPRS